MKRDTKGNERLRGAAVRPSRLMPNLALREELETFKQHFGELKESEGKYAVICHKDVVGTFDSYSEALQIGYNRFGMDDFLVKRISKNEMAAFIAPICD